MATKMRANGLLSVSRHRGLSQLPRRASWGLSLASVAEIRHASFPVLTNGGPGRVRQSFICQLGLGLGDLAFGRAISFGWRSRSEHDAEFASHGDRGGSSTRNFRRRSALRSLAGRRYRGKFLQRVGVAGSESAAVLCRRNVHFATQVATGVNDVLKSCTWLHSLVTDAFRLGDRVGASMIDSCDLRPAIGATVCHSSSVMNGISGWARRSTVSSTRASVRRVPRGFPHASPVQTCAPWPVRYQSQNSSQTNS